MRKKLISLWMAVLFLWQSLPQNALAEIVNPIPTGAEVAAAVAVTGLSEDAPGFHPGMQLSPNMNALQMAGWLEEYEEENLFYLTEMFEDYDRVLTGMQQDNPAAYQRFESRYSGTIIDFYVWYGRTREHQDDLKYCRDALTMESGNIYAMAEKLQDGDTTEKEKLICAYEIRESVGRLKQVMADLAEDDSAWKKGFTPWETEEDYGRLCEMLDALDETADISGKGALRAMDVPAEVTDTAPDQTILTRLARLSPVSAALADEDQMMHVTILDDKYFAVCVRAEGAPLSGVRVRVTGADGKAQDGETDGKGNAVFEVRGFKVREDGIVSINVSLNKDGYQQAYAPGIWVKKGGKISLEMKKDDGTPYPIAWTFWGNDALKSEYTVVTNEFNDTDQEIGFRVSSGQSYSLKMYFRDRDGKHVFDVGTGTGGAGEQSFTFKGRYLQKVPADSRLVAELTAGGQTRTFTANLVMEAAKVPAPMGDPLFKGIMVPGLEFKLPDSWPAPLKGLVVALNIPVADKIKVRAFINLNGHGAITVGSTIFDDEVKEFNDTKLWKSQDKRTMDRAIQAAEEQGTIAKAKAANGGDWAGRSKWNAFKLGSIALEMSAFGFAQIQYRTSKRDYGEIFGKGGAGLVVGIGGEAGLQWPFVSITLGAKLSATVFADIAIRMHTYWPTGRKLPTVSRFQYVKGSLNYLLRLELTLTFTVGLKGVLSASIGGLGFLELQFRPSFGVGTLDEWLKNGNSVGAGGEVPLTVYGGASFMIIVEIFWFKTTYYPFTPSAGMWKWQLSPGPVKRISENGTPNMTERFIAWLLSSAQAAEEEQQEGVLQVEQENDDLNLQPKARKVDAPAKAEKLEVIRMEVSPAEAAQDQPSEGKDILLQLRSEEDTGHPVLTYSLLDENGKDGMRILPLERGDVYTPGAGYDVIDYGWWLQKRSAKEPELFAAIPDSSDYVRVRELLFTVSILAREYEEKTLTREGASVQCLIPRETWAAVNCYVLLRDRENETVLVPLQPALYVNGADKAEGKKEFRALNEVFGAGSSTNPNGNPQIFGRATVSCAYATLSETYFGQFDIHVLTTPLNVSDEESRVALYTTLGGSFDPAEADQEHYRISVKSADDPINEIIEPEIVITQNQYLEPDIDSRLIENPPLDAVLPKPARIALFHKKGESAKLQTLVFEQNVNGKSVQIADRVLSMAATDEKKPYRVFFTQQLPDQKEYTLKSVTIDPATADMTVTDYDLPMPAADLQFVKLYGRDCIYWMEKGGTDEKENAFRIRGVWAESAESISLPFELGWVKTRESDGSVTGLCLNDSNNGFYNVESGSGSDKRLSLYRFHFKLTMGLNLIGNVLQDTLASPGSYDDMVVTYQNNGNVPLTGMDLAAYRRTGNGTDEKFETIHLDLLNPENNVVTLQEGLKGAAEERKGEKVARPEESSLGKGVNEYRQIRSSNYKAEGNRIRMSGAGQTRMMKPRMLMPESYGAHNISLLIPQEWSGNQEIYLKVERLYTTDSAVYTRDITESRGAVTGEKIISVGVRNEQPVLEVDGREIEKGNEPKPDEHTDGDRVDPDDGNADDGDDGNTDDEDDGNADDGDGGNTDDGNNGNTDDGDDWNTDDGDDGNTDDEDDGKPDDGDDGKPDDGDDGNTDDGDDGNTDDEDDGNADDGDDGNTDDGDDGNNDDGDDGNTDDGDDGNTDDGDDGNTDDGDDGNTDDEDDGNADDGDDGNTDDGDDGNDEYDEYYEYYDVYETEITYDSVPLYTEPDDLEILASLWEDDGEKMTTITVNNRKHIPETQRRGGVVTIEGYVDEQEDPSFRYSLPEEVSDKETWNLELPLKQLTKGKKASQIRIKVEGKNYTENGEFDNEAVLYLDADSLMILTQPKDQTVPEGGAAEFRVEAAGGRSPYLYRWQVKKPGGEWMDLENETEDTLKLTGVTMEMNGSFYRCIVGDSAGYELASRGAKLTVFRVPHTGDDAPAAGWLAGILTALAGLGWLILRRRKNGRNGAGLLMLCLMTAAAMTAAPAARAEPEDPVIVRVGEVTYPLSIARYSLQSNLDLMLYQGYEATEEEKQELVRQTVEHLTELGLIENKLKEAGQNDLTPEEESMLRSYAGNVYESLWQSFRERVKSEGYEATEKQITQWLGEQGYTLDAVYREALVRLRNERILKMYCADVTITPGETEEYLRRTFIEPDREAYEHDIPRYEREILDTGNESFYTPEGYRVIRQILLPYPPETTEQLRKMEPELDAGAKAVEAAYSAVAEAGISGGDVEAARAEYRAREDEYAALLNRVAETEESALQLVKGTTDEILRKFAEGQSFESLIEEYAQEAGEDAGKELLFHAQSEKWAENFRSRVSVLRSPGEITEPFVTNLGIHIVYYQSDFPSGEHELTEEERQALEASALEAKQTEKLRGMMAEWRNEYPIETHPELLQP